MMTLTLILTKLVGRFRALLLPVSSFPSAAPRNLLAANDDTFTDGTRACGGAFWILEVVRFCGHQQHSNYHPTRRATVRVSRQERFCHVKSVVACAQVQSCPVQAVKKPCAAL